MQNTNDLQRFIPTHCTAVINANNGIAYASEAPNAAGIWEAIGYEGKSSKRSFYYAFRSEEKMQQHLSDWQQSLERAAAYKAEAKARKAADRAAGHSLEVGTILVHTFGYSMTIVHFYQVVRRTANSVWIQRLSLNALDSHRSGSERVMPGTELSGPVEMKRVSRDSVKMDSGHAYKWDGQPAYQNLWD